MPYSYVENHSECEGAQGALVVDETGEVVGCHSTEDEARRQQAAIEANKSQEMQNQNVPDSNILVSPYGGTLKSMDDKGTFGGMLVQFGSIKEHDLERDFFDGNTNFWLNGRKGVTAVLYDHGQDETLGKKRIDKEGGQLVVKDAGVWLETQLQRRNEYEDAIHQLAKDGKLGLSSGTASHLVKRNQVGTNKRGKSVTHIKQWPLGLDGSLTPEPAEPRTKVEHLEGTKTKSLKSYLEDKGVNTNKSKDNLAILVPRIKATDEDIDARFEKFNDTVNMSASEIEDWGESECSDLASQKPQTVRNRVVNLLRTNKEDWGQKEFEDAGRVISFVNRMRGVTGGDETSQDNCPTKKEIALRNWGYNTAKSEKSMSDLDNILSSLKDLNEEIKKEHSYSQGDLVAWEGGDAQGMIVRQVEPNDEVSPSLTDRTFSGEEDNPGYLIELVDKDDNDEVVGRDETVFHLEDTLMEISESEVKHYVQNSIEEISRELDTINSKLSK